MSYIAPKKDELLYANRASVGLYKSPSTTAERLQTSSEHDHSLRDYEAGEVIGKLVSQETYPSPEGTLFVKVEYWTWERAEGDNIFGFKIVGKGNVQLFHEGYLNTEDEPEGWVRATWRDLQTKQSEQIDKEAEILTALKNYPKVPQPLTIEKKTKAGGGDYWLLTWENGYSADYEVFLKLAAADKITLTTQAAGTKTPLTGNSLTDTPIKTPGTASSIFTTTNILIGVAVLGLFVVLLTFYLKKK